MPDLPFKILAAPAAGGRGVYTYTVILGGEPVTSEKYAPGDGDRRRKVAAAWARDKRLSNAKMLLVSDVAHALEAVEHAAMAAEPEDDDAGGVEDPTGAAAWADREIIAEIAWNYDRRGVDFIVFDRATRQVTRQAVIETAAGELSPPAIARPGIVTPGGAVPGNVFIPTDAEQDDADDGLALREALAAFIGRYVELPADSVVLAIEYILLSWVHDAFQELPYLAFRTPDMGRGKSRALETIGSVCYRPLFVGGGSSAAATLRILDVFGGTLVSDEFDPGKGQKGSELGAELNRILNQGFQARRPLVKCDGERNEPRAFNCFGPKLFALRTRLADDATESRTISIWMQQRTRDDIPLNLPREVFDREALALRNRLLGWRFANLGHTKIDPTLADSGLEDRANQIGLPLLSVARDAETRGRVIGALREQQAAVAADRAETWEGEVFSAILTIAEPGGSVRPRAVAAAVNRARAEAAGVPEADLSDRRRMTPERAGRIMRRELALPRGGKDMHGAWYSLPEERLKQLGMRFGDGVVHEAGGTLSDRHDRQTVIPSAHRHAENGVFDSASGDYDGHDGHDGLGTPPGVPSSTVSGPSCGEADAAPF